MALYCIKMKQIIYILVIITCLSCSKKEVPEAYCQEGHINSALPTCFEGFLFDTSSYWTYLNTPSLQLDSVYVTSWDTVSYSISTNCAIENICFINLSNYKKISLSNAGADDRYDGCFQYGPGEGGGKSICNFCSSSIVIDSIQVNSVMYYDVIEFEDSYNNKTYYYKENIGLLKETYVWNNDTTSRELVNYQVTLFPNPF